MKSCPDGGHCQNEGTIEDLREALAVCVLALEKYQHGYTWPHIAREAIETASQLVSPDCLRTILEEQTR